MRRDTAPFESSQHATASPVRGGLPAFVAAAVLLNALLALELPSPARGWESLLRVSPDFLLVLGALALIAGRGARFGWALWGCLSATVILLRVFQSADSLVPLVFNREFSLYFDARRLPDLVFLFRQTRPPGIVVLAAAAVPVVAASLGIGVGLALRSLHAGLRSGGPARTALALAAVLVPALIGAAAFPDPGRSLWSRSCIPRLAAEVAFIFQLPRLRAEHQAVIRSAMTQAGEMPSDLRRLAGTSVFVIVIESYGRSALTDPRLSGRVLPQLVAAEAQLRAAGFSLCSSYLDSPTFGGGSWLAHATLATGVRADSQLRHDILLESGLTPLAEYFNRAGYHTVRATPGTLWPWPEGSFYRFAEVLRAPDLGYRGPAFGYAAMPDQFVLDRVHRRVIQNASAPLLVEFILVGSHAPFDVQAPYLADWDRIADGSVFHSLTAATFSVDWSRIGDASDAYSAAVAHSVRVLSEFISRFILGDALVVILGDHQPAPELTGFGEPASVPVHVISRSPALLAPFTRRGYTEGLHPLQPPAHPGLETFFWDFLRDFSGEPA
jgi:hypothetical protein